MAAHNRKTYEAMTVSTAVVAAPRCVKGAEVRADLVSVRQIQVGVERQRILVVLTGAGWLVEQVIGTAEAAERAGLLVAVAGVDGDGVSGGMMVQGVGESVGGVRGRAEIVEPKPRMCCHNKRLQCVAGSMDRWTRSAPRPGRPAAEEA